MIRLAAAVAAALLAAACSRGEGKTAGGPRAVPVRVATAVEKDMPVEIRAVGRIVSSQSVAIRPQVSGTIVGVHFVEGRSVKKGDLLLEIDRRPFEAALAEARAKLAQDRVRADNARADATRYADLVEKEFVTRQQYEAARANAEALVAQLAADEAAVERARLNLAYASIRAPISGRTGRLLVHEGNLVSGGSPEPLLTIEQVKPVQAEFSIPERHLPALQARRGAPPPVRLATSGGGPEIQGKLSFVNNTVDAATGTILLKAEVPNEDEALLPGQIVDVHLRIAERAKAVVVPASAVASGQKGDYAYVVTADRKVQLRPVQVDQAGETEVVLGKGVAAGEQVVTEGLLKLRPDAPVEILQDQAAAR
jgi:multidrug efflux system membrane fusion protein